MKLKRVRAQNFRSIDRMGMELFYEEGTTMVGSIDNGAGKSTLLVFALYYGFFDKNYAKGSSKAKLINNRSNKETLVEIEWEHAGHTWVLHRGMKPAVFSMWKDGVPIDEEAALRDMQANLSKISMDERVFCNTVVLGLDKFVPFVSMTAADRRNHGEQMMDLTVIGSMSATNKEDIKVYTAKRNALDARSTTQLNAIRNLNEMIAVKKRHVAEAAETVQADINVLQDERQLAAIKKHEFAQTLLRLDEEAVPYDQAIAAENTKATAQVQAQQRKQSYEAMLQRLQADSVSMMERLQAVDSATCTCCGQVLPADQRDKHRVNLQAKAMELLEGADMAQAELNKIVVPDYSPARMEELKAGVAAIRERAQRVRMEEHTVNAQLVDMDRRLQALRQRMQAVSAVVSWAEEEAQLAKATEDYAATEAEMTEVLDLLAAKQAIQESLADDAVKAQIAEQFLPYLNERVNYYLQTLNLYLNIRIDNEFDIKMEAPDRRNQTIHDLSAGQQRRVDLSVLLAWRDIARATSSCDCNILVLDEILENLSEAGVADFLEMWQAQAQPTDGLYVVTQRRSEFQPLFDRAIIYSLVDESTRLVNED